MNCALLKRKVADITINAPVVIITVFSTNITTGRVIKIPFISGLLTQVIKLPPTYIYLGCVNTT